MNEQRTLDISWGTICKVALAVLFFYVFLVIRNILIWTLFGVVISIIFDPAIDALQRFKVPRAVAAVTLYVAVFGLLVSLIYGISPFFGNEIQKFSQLLPQYLETIAPALKNLGVITFSNIQDVMSAAAGGIGQLGSNVLNAVSAIFGGLFAAIYIISIAIFLSIEEKGIEREIVLLFPKKVEALLLNVWDRSKKKVGGWFLSRILACLFVAVGTYAALALFNVQYPLSLGLLTGIANIVPIIGPLVMGVLVGLVVALDSLTKALFVLIAIVLIQQIEGSIITPLLSRKLVGISPALVLISLAIGAELWGVMGAILALPLAGVLSEFLHDFLRKRRESNA